MFDPEPWHTITTEGEAPEFNGYDPGFEYDYFDDPYADALDEGADGRVDVYGSM